MILQYHFFFANPTRLATDSTSYINGWRRRRRKCARHVHKWRKLLQLGSLCTHCWCRLISCRKRWRQGVLQRMRRRVRQLDATVYKMTSRVAKRLAECIRMALGVGLRIYSQWPLGPEGVLSNEMLRMWPGSHCKRESWL